MKRILFILSLLLAMQVSAQVEIIIGDTTSTQTSSRLPLSVDYRYSYTQSVYKRSELVAGEISSISYYFTSESLSAGTISIYMKETSDSVLNVFSSSEGFVQVFSGALNLTNGWTTFVFPEIFEYSGQNNLVVAVIKSDNSYSYGHNFKVSASDSCSIYRYTDMQAYDLNSTHGSGSVLALRPVTKFGMFPSEDYCYPPINLYTYVSSSDTATISWSPGDSSSSVFALAYKTDAEEEWTVENDEITDTSYTLTSLLPYTKYNIKLWTVCPNGNSFSQYQTFITQPNDGCFIYLTYEEDFDDLGNLSPWRYTHIGENKWHVGPAVNNTRDIEGFFTEGNALYISNDGGLTNSYNNAETSTSHFSTLITITDSVYYGISFDYKLTGDGYADKLSVYLVPLYQELTTSTNGFISLGTLTNTHNTWRRFEKAIPQSLSAGIYQLVFTWNNNNYNGENPPAAIDNLRVQASMCAIPTGISATVSDIDGTASMTVSISDTVNSASSYIVEYRLAGETVWDTVQGVNPILIPYLPYSSVIEYRVVASCGAGGLSMPSNIITIKTPCGPTDEYPYKEYFEVNPLTYNSDPSFNCWKIINGGDELCIWQHTASEGIKGSNAIRYTSFSFSSDLVFDDWLISPVFALNGNQRLNFQYKLPYLNQLDPRPKIDVYLYNTDIVDYSSPEDTIYCEYVTTIYDSTLEISKWKMAEILLSDYIGNYRIALVIREQNPTFYLDNFIVSDIPDCFEVYGLDVNAYSGTSVSINYEIDNISGAGVAIAYAPETVNHNFDVESADVEIISGDEELPYILEGLEPGTTYVFAASQLCGGEWSDTTKAIMPMVYTVPFSFDFETEETTPQISFTRDDGQNTWFLGGLYNSYYDGDTLAGRSLYVTNDNGTSASYSHGNGYNCYAYLNVNFAQGAEYELFFDWMCEGVVDNDYLKVYLLPFGQTISEEYAITEQLNLSTQWRREQIILPAHHYNGGYQLVFAFETNNWSSEYYLSAIIDNIRIEVNDCARIVDLGLSVSESENVPNLVVDLLDQFNTNASYVLRYKESNQAQYTEITGLTRDSFPYIISNGIEYQKIYQMQIGVICEQGDAPYFNEEVFSIMTPCTVLPTPWEERFDENILEEQYCWTRYNGLISAYDTTYTENLELNSSWTVENVILNGVNSQRLRARVRGTELKDWVVTPPINLGNQGNIKQIVFDLALRPSNLDEPAVCGDDDKFMVAFSLDNGVSWDIHNAIVFRNNDQDTLHNLSSFSNQPFPFSFKLVDENNQPITGLIKIAFYVESTIATTDNVLCIDNLSVEDWLECQTPHNPQVLPQDIRSNSAIVNFTTLDNLAEYFEYVVVEGECNNFDTLSTLFSSETSILLPNLEEETLYSFAVRGVCENEIYSQWISTTFTTIREPKLIPFETTFSDSIRWYVTTNGVSQNSWSIGTATSADTNGRAAYISTDEGISYDAEISQTPTIAYLYQDVAFGETMNNFELFFDWKAIGRVTGTNVASALYVYLLDIEPLPTSTLLPDPILTLHSSEQWQSERVFLGNIIGDKRLVFAAYGYTTENEIQTPAAIDNVRLITSPCSVIENVAALNTTTNSIELVWDSTDATTYVVYYKDDFSTSYQTMTTTDNYASFTNLSSSSCYYFKIKGLCGENESLFSEELTVFTLSEIATLPYSCDFEGPATNGWTIKNGTCENRWWVGNVENSSNSSLFITGDNGVSNNINPTQRSIVIAEKQFQLGQRDSLRISFDVKIPDNGGLNYLKVFFVPETVEFEPSTSIQNFAYAHYSDGILMTHSINESSSVIEGINQTQNLSITIPTPFNERRKLVFVWVNSMVNLNSQGAIIDNVVLEEVGDIITCVKPVANSVRVTRVLQTTAEVYWQDEDQTHNAWNVYYKAEGDTYYQMVTATNQCSITLENLYPYTRYSLFVKTNCGDTESYPTDTIRFCTHCEEIAEFPYVANFNGGDLSCWITQEGRVNNWTILNNTTLLYDALDYDTVMIESPIFNLVSLPHPTLSFGYSYTSNWYGAVLKVLYRENQGDEWGLLREYTTQASVNEVISLHHTSSNYQIAFQAIGAEPSDFHVYQITIYSSPTGSLIAEEENTLQTILYPNPALKETTLQVEGLSTDAQITISDLQGRIISRGVMKANEKTYTINLSEFASGVYYIRIVADETISTQKLIVE
jgi:hypothetical protein